MQKKHQELNNDELTRYSRHIILPNVGKEGQQRLKNSRVLIVGAGALGSPVGMYLAAAGVGTIGIVDFDIVDETNLQRQIIHGTSDIGKAKIESAKRSLEEINPNINIVVFNAKLTSENAINILKDFDIVSDGTDNFPTRYLINDACVFLKKPYVYGSIFRFDGQVSVFDSKKGPCYRCLSPVPPPPFMVPSCGEGGVFGVLPGVIGTIQATEIIKHILQIGDLLLGKLLLFDALKLKFQEIKLSKNENCPVCGANPSIINLIDYDDFCGLKNVSIDKTRQINAIKLKQMLDEQENINIIDIRDYNEFSISSIKTSINIPAFYLERRIKDIDMSKKTIFVCKVGTRSFRIIKTLENAGIKGDFYNLEGGIISWIKDIDKDIAKY